MWKILDSVGRILTGHSSLNSTGLLCLHIYIFKVSGQYAFFIIKAGATLMDNVVALTVKVSNAMQLLTVLQPFHLIFILTHLAQLF